MRTRNLLRDLCSMAFAHSAASLLGEAQQLLVGDFHISQKLTSEQKLRGHGLNLGLRIHGRLVALRSIVERGGHGHDSLSNVTVHGLDVGIQGNRKSVQKVRPQDTLLRIPGRDHKWAAWMRNRETLALDAVHAALDGGEEQADQILLQQVDVVDVEDTAMGLGKKARLEDWLS